MRRHSSLATLLCTHFYALNRAEFLQHYHKRANIDMAFQTIKSKFVDGFGVDSQHRSTKRYKVLCHNLCPKLVDPYELGIKAGFGQHVIL